MHFHCDYIIQLLPLFMCLAIVGHVIPSCYISFLYFLYLWSLLRLDSSYCYNITISVILSFCMLSEELIVHIISISFYDKADILSHFPLLCTVITLWRIGIYNTNVWTLALHIQCNLFSQYTCHWHSCFRERSLYNFPTMAC